MTLQTTASCWSPFLLTHSSRFFQSARTHCCQVSLQISVFFSLQLTRHSSLASWLLFPNWPLLYSIFLMFLILESVWSYKHHIWCHITMNMSLAKCTTIHTKKKKTMFHFLSGQVKRGFDTEWVTKIFFCI